MIAREGYKCPICGETKFIQIVKEENFKEYDSTEHIITYKGNCGVGGPWACVNCGELIPLKLLHDLFSGIEFKDFPILDLEREVKELKEKLGILEDYEGIR